MKTVLTKTKLKMAPIRAWTTASMIGIGGNFRVRVLDWSRIRDFFFVREWRRAEAIGD